MSKAYDLIIIGAGPAGLTGAVYASRCFSLKTLVIGSSPGGQMAESGRIDNYPGFKSISGWDLTERMRNQAESFGAEILTKKVTSVNRQNKIFSVLAGHENYEASSILVAIGAGPRKLGVSGEDEFYGKGVSYCALCDAPFYKDKVVGIVGGGDSALDGSLELSEHAKKLYLIHRRDEFRAKPNLAQQVKEKDNIELVLDANVARIEGSDTVEKIVLDTQYHESDFLEVEGLFIEIGSVPEKSFLQSIGLDLDESGYVIVNDDMSTNISGVYAAGDVTNGSNEIKQIVTACSEGAIATKSIYNFVRSKRR